MYNTLLAELEEGILTVTINRPDKLNAINSEVMKELGEVVEYINSNEGVKCAMITGAGTKAFVAGADISEFMQYSTKEGTELSQKGHTVFDAINSNSKPIVAAVNGFALGGGCELAMACHFRIASENAKFGQPEVNLGLIPGYGGTQRLPMLVGKGMAMQLMMTGDMIDANEAKSIGLVNYVVPADELIIYTRKILLKIISKAPLAVSKVISSVNAHYESHRPGFWMEISEFGKCFATEDMKEGAAAFLEKRKPEFKCK